MDLVILSGKGGTGKTTVSVNLASVAHGDIALLDCDVEEPNSHLFVNKELQEEKSVFTLYPEVSDSCIHCGKCGSFCEFNAILSTSKHTIVMKELCHDCGGCEIICPVNAISYEKREVGKVRSFLTEDGKPFRDGVLNTGEFSSTKVIGSVLECEKERAFRIIDAPPGSACAAVETVEGADLALVVTEPTPFALSDMKMVIEMLENMKIPTAVFVNKSGDNEGELLEYCRNKNLRVLGKLPFSVDYSMAYAEGNILSDEFPEVREIFTKLWRDISEY